MQRSTLAGILALTLGTAALISSPLALADTIETQRHDVQLTTVAEGLENPWGLAFIGDGRYLVTERPGRMRIVTADGTISEPLGGVPDVFAQNQGGLLDVTTDPDFADNQLIYFSFSEGDANANGTSVARAKLGDGEITDVEVIFQMAPKVQSTGHFGSRLVFSDDGHLYVTLGDRQTEEHRDNAQDPSNHIGTIVRINSDGSAPSDNPYADGNDGAAEVWSYGHRNIQGADIHPDTGELWTAEHGPRGGDEINIPAAGKNYGWPEATHGIDYDGSEISDKTWVEGTERPHYYWVPSIAIAGMTFYSGDKFPEWQGDLFVGALRGQQVARLDLDGDHVMHEETLFEGDISRVRAIEEGPDGYIYILTDMPEGQLVKVEPAE